MPSIGKTVLFGGRSFAPVSLTGVGPVSTPYPESLAGGLLADTWTYDGTTWASVPTGSPPDAREGSQLVYDAARGVLVLVGGHTATDVAPDIDRLSIWEFDGTDWSQKLVAGDPTLPPSLATRHGASAFYNSARQRTTILGGASDLLDFCILTAAQIASAQQAARGNTAATAALQQTGCLGGFVHDQWEWDGHSMVNTANVVFGGVQEGAPVFEQAAGDPSWQAEGPAGGADGGAPTSLVTALIAYRYDERPDHFALRTALDRAHYSDAGADPPTSKAVGVDALGAGAGASPLFMATVHADAFDPRDASTWSYTDAQGWQALSAAGAPSPWAVDPAVHSKGSAPEASDARTARAARRAASRVATARPRPPSARAARPPARPTRRASSRRCRESRRSAGHRRPCRRQPRSWRRSRTQAFRRMTRGTSSSRARRLGA